MQLFEILFTFKIVFSSWNKFYFSKYSRYRIKINVEKIIQIKYYKKQKKNLI